MENNSYIPLLKIYTSRLDPKGRCTFPSELRDGKKNIPVYLFYSPEFQRAIAVLDPDILQKRFPGNYHQIPLQKWDINDQGKLYLGESFFKFTDIPLATIKEVTFMVTGGDNELIEIYFSDNAVKATMELKKKVADSVVRALLNIQNPFTVNIGPSQSCFGLIDEEIHSTMTTNL